MVDERGSATVLGIAMLACVVTVSSLMLTAGERGIQAIKLRSVADLSAVAAADALRGLNSGFPCATAEQVSTSNGFLLQECQVIESDVLVRLRTKPASNPTTAGARAGSP